MMKSLWIAKTGLDAQQSQLDVVSNNLANTSTAGFKRSRAVFEDLMYQTMRQPGAQIDDDTQIPSGLQIGTGAKIVSTVKNFTQGNLNPTENMLDVAINGKGFFPITMPDGTTNYTRDGSFQLNSDGEIVTSNGYQLEGPIVVPPEAINVTIGQNGVVSAITIDDPNPQVIGQIELVEFINPAGLDSRGQNLFAQTAASGEPNQGLPGTDGKGLLSQGFVETSNVNVVEELVNMIQTQRAYEINSKAITTSDQMLARLTQL